MGRHHLRLALTTALLPLALAACKGNIAADEDEAPACFGFKPVCASESRLKVCVDGALANEGNGYVDCNAFCAYLNADPQFPWFEGRCAPWAPKAEGDEEGSDEGSRAAAWCECVRTDACVDESRAAATGADPNCRAPRRCRLEHDQTHQGEDGHRVWSACLCDPTWQGDVTACQTDQVLGLCRGGEYLVVDCAEYCAATEPGGKTSEIACRTVHEDAEGRLAPVGEDEVPGADARDGCWCAPSPPACVPECEGLECGPAHNRDQPGREEARCCQGHACGEGEQACASCVLGRCLPDCSTLALGLAEAKVVMASPGCCARSNPLDARTPGDAPEAHQMMLVCRNGQEPSMIRCGDNSVCGWRRDESGYVAGCFDREPIEAEEARMEALAAVRGGAQAPFTPRYFRVRDPLPLYEFFPEGFHYFDVRCAAPTP